MALASAHALSERSADDGSRSTVTRRRPRSADRTSEVDSGPGARGVRAGSPSPLPPLPSTVTQAALATARSAVVIPVRDPAIDTCVTEPATMCSTCAPRCEPALLVGRCRRLTRALALSSELARVRAPSASSAATLRPACLLHRLVPLLGVADDPRRRGSIRCGRCAGRAATYRAGRRTDAGGGAQGDARRPCKRAAASNPCAATLTLSIRVAVQLRNDQPLWCLHPLRPFPADCDLQGFGNRALRSRLRVA